jgi:hypothetical protein
VLSCIECNDVLFIGEVVGCTPGDGDQWGIDVKGRTDIDAGTLALENQQIREASHATDLVVFPRSKTEDTLAEFRNTYARDWKFFSTDQNVDCPHLVLDIGRRL